MNHADSTPFAEPAQTPQVYTEIVQGTPQWHELRLGKVTASRFKSMMTNGRGKDTMGQTAYSYMYDLIVERLTGQQQDKVDAKSLQWGRDHEPEARAMYCVLHGVRVQQVAFVLHPAIGGVGGSPDGLIDGEPSGGVEIKCPMNSRIHIGYLEFGGVPKDYYWQVQGLMWLTGRSWWDFVSYDQRMPERLRLFVHREQADTDAHEELEERTIRFIEQMEIKLMKISKHKGT